VNKVKINNAYKFRLYPKTAQENRKVVQNMLTAEWSPEVEERAIRADERLTERLTFARRLKAKGMSVDEIVELTDLSVDEVLKA